MSHDEDYRQSKTPYLNPNPWINLVREAGERIGLKPEEYDRQVGQSSIQEGLQTKRRQRVLALADKLSRYMPIPMTETVVEP